MCYNILMCFKSLLWKCQVFTKLRYSILHNKILRELFYYMSRRKAPLKKIDRKLLKLQTYRKKILQDCIVSLTTYGERFSEVKYALYSLITQSVSPERIVVNIAYGDAERLASELLYFQKFGVEFNFYEDIKSYKKLIPVLLKYPTKNIVTCDDDLYYPKDWLRELWSKHIENPKAVICHLAYKITHNRNKVNNYQQWIHNYKFTKPDNSIFILGGSGVLYPPGSLHKDVTNKAIFNKVAPYADDLWFYFMTILNKTSIFQVKHPYINLRFINPDREYGIKEGETLNQKNVYNNKNDEQFKNIMQYYNISEEMFIQFISNRQYYLEI